MKDSRIHAMNTIDNDKLMNHSVGGNEGSEMGRLPSYFIHPKGILNGSDRKTTLEASDDL